MFTAAAVIESLFGAYSTELQHSSTLTQHQSGFARHARDVFMIQVETLKNSIITLTCT